MVASPPSFPGSSRNEGLSCLVRGCSLGRPAEPITLLIQEVTLLPSRRLLDLWGRDAGFSLNPVLRHAGSGSACPLPSY